MSFGYAVGDVIAVLGLVERLYKEVQCYRDAPTHFQNLRVELSLLQKTLHEVLQLQPRSMADVANIDHIRAVAMHCQQPIQKFIDKMRLKDDSLGHSRTARSFASVRTRLHWSMIARSDVDDIRKVILSELSTISLLLGIRQLGYIDDLSAYAIRPIADSVQGLHQKTDGLMQQSDRILTMAAATPSAIADLEQLIHVKHTAQVAHSQYTDQRLDSVTTQISAMSLTGQETLAITKSFGVQFKSSFLALLAILASIQKLLQKLYQCSEVVLEQCRRSVKAILDIQAQMKRIVRAIEAIPLHLTLGIVRLDDALGESWALPFQACTRWETFNEMLNVVVFANSRPGSSLVAAEQFVIVSARTGQSISRLQWSSHVKSGDHIQQAMLVPNHPESGVTADSESKCLYLQCDGLVNTASNSSDNGLCLKCGRWSRVDRKVLDLVQDLGPVEPLFDQSGELERREGHIRRRKNLPGLSSTIHDISKISLFRRVYVRDYVEAVRSLAEATDLLQRDPSDPRAHQYLGWYHLRGVDGRPDPDKAIDSLILSVAKDATHPQSWYLLGRAYLRRVPPDFQSSYEAYQQCVCLHGKSPLTWSSVAVLYFEINQYRDSLVALSRSIRLDPYRWVNWYDLGVLYDACNNHKSDARDAFRRCIELNPGFLPAVRRAQEIDVLLATSTDGHAKAPYKTDMIEPELLHVDEQMQPTGPTQDIEFSPLDLGEEENLYDRDEDGFATVDGEPENV